MRKIETPSRAKFTGHLQMSDHEFLLPRPPHQENTVALAELSGTATGLLSFYSPACSVA